MDIHELKESWDAFKETPTTENHRLFNDRLVAYLETREEADALARNEIRKEIFDAIWEHSRTRIQP